MAPFSLSLEVENVTLEATYDNTDILRFVDSKRFGRWSLLNCIYYDGFEREVTIFGAREEELMLIDYGWVPVTLWMPPTEIINAWYKMAELPPEARN